MTDRSRVARAVFVVAHLALVGAATAAIVLSRDVMAARAIAVTIASIAVVCGVALRPAGLRAFGTSAVGVLLRAACVAFAAVVPIVLACADRLPAEVLVAPAGAAGLLSLVFDRLAGTFDPSDNGSTTSILVLGIIGLFSTAPLWLGPWVEAAPSSIVDGVVWASPLSFISSAAGYDYLRSAWFYAYTSLGGLRYSLPDPLGATVAYAVLGTLLWIAAKWRATPMLRSTARNP